MPISKQTAQMPAQKNLDPLDTSPLYFPLENNSSPDAGSAGVSRQAFRKRAELFFLK
jgi:hypothetical protein